MNTRYNIIFISCILACIFFIFLLGQANPASAQEESYDPYVDDINYDKVREELKKSTAYKVAEIPAAPFDITKYALEKAFIVIEKYHIDRKLVHTYEAMAKRGFYPKLHGFGGRWATFGGGMEYNHNILRGKPLFDALNLRGWGYISSNLYQRYGSEITLTNCLGTGLGIFSGIDYRNYSREDFFGVGPRTSRGDGVDFRFEDLTATTGIKRNLPFDLSGDATLGWSRTMIFEGKGDKPDIKRYYTDVTLPGLDGANRFFAEVGLVHDTRDNKDDPRKGGYQRLKFGYYTSVSGDKFDYFKYRAEAAQFIPIFGPERILALRLLFDFNEGIDSGTVPFFDMARLGGYNNLRGYQFNRFFDRGRAFFSSEYRYQIWKYKEFSADAVPFFEFGEVFDEIGRFRASDLRYSYGLGFRVKYKRKAVTLEVAHSSDGTEVYLGMGAPF